MSRDSTTVTSTNEGYSTISSISNMVTCPLNSHNSENAMCSEVSENTLTPNVVPLDTSTAYNGLSALSECDVLGSSTGKEKTYLPILVLKPVIVMS